MADAASPYVTSAARTGGRWRLALTAGAVVLAILTILVAGLAALDLRATRVSVAEGLDLRIQATPSAVARLGLVKTDFDIDGQGTAFFAPSSGGLGAIDASGRPHRHGLDGKPLTSLALDQRGDLLTIAGGFLGRINADGSVLQAAPLPYDDARLSRSVHGGAILLYGSYGGQWGLYRFWENGRFDSLLASPERIVAATDTGSAVYLATPGTIVRLGGDGARTLFRGPASADWGPITSLAVTLDGQVLFATPAKLWVLTRSGLAASLINDAGGQIRFRDGRIHLFDPRRRLLLSIGLPAASRKE